MDEISRKRETPQSYARVITKELQYRKDSTIQNSFGGNSTIVHGMAVAEEASP